MNSKDDNRKRLFDNSKNKFKAVWLLDKLMNGDIVHIGKYDYALSDDNKFGTLAANKENLILIMQIDIPGFIKLANDMTDEEIVGKIASDISDIGK